MTRKEKIEFIKNYPERKVQLDCASMTTEELLRLKDIQDRLIVGKSLTQAQIEAALTDEEKQFIEYVEKKYIITV